PAPFVAMEVVDLVLGAADKAAPGAFSKRGVHVGDVMAVRPVALAPVPVHGRRARAPEPADGRRARAYVEIPNGCDHRCPFCVIPFGRGHSRSTPAEAVIDRARALAEGGCAEVVLTGVDLTSWGADLTGAPGLGALVARILAEVPELPRLRLSSIDAAEIDAELMAAFGREPRLMPHLHLSLQSGDDLILKRMKRRHSRSQALALIARLRAARPDIALGADFIAGFPTESEAAFENTLAFVEEAGLAFLHVFPYSPRPATPAARMPQVPGALVKDRAARLRAAGDAALRRHLDRQVGRIVRALVERPGRARAEDYTQLAITGVAAPGEVISGTVGGHDGRVAFLIE
ncbi:MAG: MiaB/RimO family radical SAM methylthiotransferase, partial [Caulobacteraceae bacterium]